MTRPRNMRPFMLHQRSPDKSETRCQFWIVKYHLLTSDTKLWKIQSLAGLLLAHYSFREKYFLQRKWVHPAPRRLRCARSAIDFSICCKWNRDWNKKRWFLFTKNTSFDVRSKLKSLSMEKYLKKKKTLSGPFSMQANNSIRWFFQQLPI